MRILPMHAVYHRLQLFFSFLPPNLISHSSSSYPLLLSLILLTPLPSTLPLLLPLPTPILSQRQEASAVRAHQGRTEIPLAGPQEVHRTPLRKRHVHHHHWYVHVCACLLLGVRALYLRVDASVYGDRNCTSSSHPQHNSNAAPTLSGENYEP
jgi:hypothetical protein